MGGPFDQIRLTLRKAEVEASLFFLTRLLAVNRGNEADPAIERKIGRLKNRPPEFIVHLLVKWLLLEAEGLSLYAIDWSRYKRLQDLYFEIDDPTTHDPAWKDAELSGFFERMIGHQMPAQQRVTTRDIGLALALFRDAGTPRNSGDYDLRGELEAELGMPVETFMAMGNLTVAARLATHEGGRVRGTLSLKYLEKAYRDGIFWCTPEVWEPFLRRVVCTRDGFRACHARPEYRVDDPLFLHHEFNPLDRFPVVDVGESRLIAVDPDLVIKRVTSGLFYDMFERDRRKFSSRFGEVFERLVGDMLQSVCAKDRLWSDAAWKESRTGKAQAQKGKRGDWALKGSAHTVLFECKSLRPSLLLRQYGSQAEIDKLRERVVEGLEQLLLQAQAIQQGAWSDEGLPPAPVVCVLVSYGRFYAVNLPFFRDRVRRQLVERGLPDLPFVVMPVEDFDAAIRLAELGVPLDEVLFKVAGGLGWGDVRRAYAEKLDGVFQTSSYAHRRWEDLEARYTDSLPGDSSAKATAASKTGPRNPGKRRRPGSQ